MNFSVTTLLLGMLSRMNVLKASGDADLQALIGEFDGEMGLMKSMAEAADMAHDLLSEDVNFNSFNTDFNLTYIDPTGVREDTLDAAVWLSVYGKTNSHSAIKCWMHDNLSFALYN
ncbi:TPA: hypothetical protein ACSCYS_003534 [Aeromonas veronii]